MADFDAWEDPHCLSQLHPKPSARRGYLFCSGFLFRLLLIALFLSALPLLPPHPPDFVSGTVFSKCWELLRLFIIGILVSYGLFGRRRSRIPTPIPISPAINPPNVLHASSIFSFEHPNPYPNGFDPTAVVRPASFEFDCEPLDLPVRSLRSRVEESDSDEECASELELEADGSSSCGSEEDMAGSSPAPWDWPNRSSSGDSGPSLSNRSSPLRSSSSMERGNFWREDVEVESSSKSPPMMADPLSGSNSRETEVFPSPLSLKSRSMRVNSMENVGVASLHVDTNLLERGHFWRERVEVETSSKSIPMMADHKDDFRPSLSESTPMGVENSRETELFASSPSLKSRSMRVNFMEENVGVDSLHVDTKLMERGHFWRERVEVETSSKSIPMMVDHKDDFRSFLSESIPMEVKNSRETELFASTTTIPIYPTDTNFPPSSGRRDSWREDEEVESSWSGPVIQENVFVSQPTPSKSLPIVVDPNEEVANVSIRSFRPSSSKGSSPFRSSVAELAPIEVEDSRMVDSKEQIGDASLHEDTESVPPLCSAVSESPSFETEIPQWEDEKRQHSESFRSPIPPWCSPASESPTTEMPILQKESKEADTSWKDNDMSPRRVGSRCRRSRKRGHIRKDVKGTMKSRTDSSCDTPSSQSLSSSSHDFASTIEPKSSRYIDGFSVDENVHRSPLNSTSMGDFECENIPHKAASPINASTEASGAHLGASSSLSKLERGTKTLSRTSHSRRFSCSSFFDRDLWKGSRDETKEFSKKGKNAEASRSGKCGWDCLKLDVEPTLTLTNKSSTRGKSVRTVRPRAITLEPSCTNDNASLERVRERQDVVIISIGISGKNARNAPPLTERSNDRNHDGRKHERGETSSLELDRNKERSEGKTCATNYLNEDEDGNSEIDRKADEFIAKFKEQIRQQKLASRRESSKHRT